MPSPGASRRNLVKARSHCRNNRPRPEDESQIIKLLIWQSRFGPGPRPSERELARQLRVSQPYVHAVLDKLDGEGLDALSRCERRVTPHDLELARTLTPAQKWHREKNPWLYK